MSIWTKYTTVAFVALAVSFVGCSDDSTPAQASLRVAHLAPEIPAVDICIDGVAAIEGLSYGEASGFAMLDAGTYAVAVATEGGCAVPETFAVKQGAGGAGGDGGTAGSGGAAGEGGTAGGGGTGGDSGGGGIVLDLGDVTLESGQSSTVVAYGDQESDAAAPVSVFVFDNSTEGLESGQGRVLVGHGADADALDPVNVVIPPAPTPASSEKQTGGNGGNGGSGGNGGGGCTTVIPDFAFGTQAGPLDLDAETITLAFNLKEEETCPPVVPPAGIETPVTENVVSILVAVLETAGVELWAIVGTADPARLIGGNGGGGTGGTGGGTGGTGGGTGGTGGGPITPTN